MPDWPAPRTGETLPHYAGRCAAGWVDGPAAVLTSSRPFHLGGVSFGGMVALEAGRALLDAGTPPAGVFLIASCRSREAVTPAFRRRAGLGTLLPDAALSWLLGGPAGRAFGRREGLDPAWRDTLCAMGRTTDVPFLKWAARASAAWGLSRGEAMNPGFPVRQIHGEQDRVIPCRPQDCDAVLPGAGHLVNVTHADAVNAFLAAGTGR